MRMQKWSKNSRLAVDVSSIITYLCYGRYQQTNKEQAEYLNSIFPVTKDLMNLIL